MQETDTAHRPSVMMTGTAVFITPANSSPEYANNSPGFALSGYSFRRYTERYIAAHSRTLASKVAIAAPSTPSFGNPHLP